ncbi:MAG: translation elongation factor Ts, partial [Mariprofundales bacterium]|nr:translation elongation factor Ts [Mariprofundales bacterium]
DGDIEAAVDLLRKKGLAAASKKAGRVAAEGVVLAKSTGASGVVIEVNSETDFVSKNEQFTSFVERVADLVLVSSPDDVEALLALPFDGERTVEQALSQLIATIGENIQIRRFSLLGVESGSVGAYVHAGGKIGVLVSVSGSSDEELNRVARNVAMHVAAVNPLSVSRDELEQSVVDRERQVLSERAVATGKPASIVDKIVDGQMRRFYAESCLVEQNFVMDSDLTVAQAVAKVQEGAQVVAMSRFQLGEGIEKRQEDFAAEVAAQVNG